MRLMKSSVMVVMGIITAATLGGCAGSYQARSVDLKQATLVNPDLLKKGEGDQLLYRYVNPKADVKQYTSMLIEPVKGDAKPTPQKVEPGVYTRSVPLMKDPQD